MVYSPRKNMGRLRPVYQNNDSSSPRRIMAIGNSWKAQERTIAQGERTSRKTDGGGWSDIDGRLTSKHEAARKAGFSGREHL